MKIKETINHVLELADKKSPAILTGCCVAGVFILAGMVVKPKVDKIMAKHKERVSELEETEKDPEAVAHIKKDITADTAKELVKSVAPTVIIAGATAACALGANHKNARRVAAISAAYEIASRKAEDLADAIEDVVPKKAEEIKEKAIAKHVKETPIPDDSYIYSTGKGDVLCKDIYTKVFFRSSHEEIMKAINKLSAQVRDEQWVSLSDLYYELGVKNVPPVANDIGWHVDDCVEGNLPIMITTCFDDSGTIPVIGLDYEVDPFYKEGGRFRGR